MIAKTNPSDPKPRKYNSMMPILATMLLLTMMSCSLLSSNEGDDTLKETQIALAVQQTSLAKQEAAATQAALDAASGGELPASTETLPAASEATPPDIPATQAALQATQAALEAAGASPPPPTAPGQTPPEPPAPTQPEGDLRTLMQSASILVFEDMANDPAEYRYVEKTLKAMSLNHKWDGSAKGTFKSDILAGAPGGGPWDLVIVASETRTGFQGELFDYVNDALNLGSSVIIEAWHLDEISSGTVSTILTRCGVQVYEYFPKSGTTNDVVVYPISGVSHPILSDPNGGLSFTKARDKWISSGDLGDHMALTGRGDAQLLMGTSPSDRDRDGVLAVCLGGQLTLQTFSSHSFLYETMYPLWENMIYNALKKRLLGAP